MAPVSHRRASCTCSDLTSTAYNAPEPGALAATVTRRKGPEDERAVCVGTASACRRAVRIHPRLALRGKYGVPHLRRAAAATRRLSWASRSAESRRCYRRRPSRQSCRLVRGILARPPHRPALPGAAVSAAGGAGLRALPVLPASHEGVCARCGALVAHAGCL